MKQTASFFLLGSLALAWLGAGCESQGGYRIVEAVSAEQEDPAYYDPDGHRTCYLGVSWFLEYFFGDSDWENVDDGYARVSYVCSNWADTGVNIGYFNWKRLEQDGEAPIIFDQVEYYKDTFYQPSPKDDGARPELQCIYTGLVKLTEQSGKLPEDGRLPEGFLRRVEIQWPYPRDDRVFGSAGVYELLITNSSVTTIQKSCDHGSCFLGSTDWPLLPDGGFSAGQPASDEQLCSEVKEEIKPDVDARAGPD